MELPLKLELRPSTQLAWLFLSGHTLAGVAVVVADLPLWPSLGLLGLVLLSGIHCHRRHVRQLGVRGIHALFLHADGTLELQTAKVGCLRASVSRQTCVFAALVVLNYRCPSYSSTLVLARDSLGEEPLRQLRLWLRWYSSFDTKQ